CPLSSPVLSAATGASTPYTLSLHDALPIWCRWAPVGALSPSSGSQTEGRLAHQSRQHRVGVAHPLAQPPAGGARVDDVLDAEGRSEEHTSELQSRENLVCRLLLEKKKR